MYLNKSDFNDDSYQKAYLVNEYFDIEKIELNNKNDLKIDFGDVYIVFYTIEDGDESWRFFTSKEEDPHLVASNLWLRFD